MAKAIGVSGGLRTAAEAEEASRNRALFDANPGAGTIGWRKGMLDRPHLSRAKQLLAQLDG